MWIRFLHLMFLKLKSGLNLSGITMVWNVDICYALNKHSIGYSGNNLFIARVLLRLMKRI